MTDKLMEAAISDSCAASIGLKTVLERAFVGELSVGNGVEETIEGKTKLVSNGMLTRDILVDVVNTIVVRSEL